MQPKAVWRRRLEAGGTVLLDGGVGAELVRRGVRWRGHGLRTDAEQVQAVHQEFLAAGVDVLRTNTFQLNRRLYLDVFRSPEHQRHIGAPGLERRAVELTRRALEVAQAARRAAGRPEVAIAGVIGPLEHCFRPDLAPDPATARAEHAEGAALLAEGGVDLLLLESMNTLAEARAALAAARATGLPVWASLVLGPAGDLLGGDPLDQAARVLADEGAEALLVNCVPADDVGPAISRLAAAVDLPLGGYAHLGRFDPPSWKLEFHPQFSGAEAWPPARYAETVTDWQARGARIVGGCCGAGPAHIAALAQARGREAGA